MMKHTEDISQLAAALALAQGEMEVAGYDKENPHFRSKYATLAALQLASRAALAKHGLSVTQATSEGENGKNVLYSKLMHKSGQWIETTMPLLLDKQTMQGMGSASTYARRQTYKGMVGVIEMDDPDDDDGNAASGLSHEKKPEKKPEKKADNFEGPLRLMFDALKTRRLEAEKGKQLMHDLYGVTASNQLTRDQILELTKYLESETDDGLSLLAEEAKASRSTQTPRLQTIITPKKDI